MFISESLRGKISPQNYQTSPRMSRQVINNGPNTNIIPSKSACSLPVFVYTLLVWPNNFCHTDKYHVDMRISLGEIGMHIHKCICIYNYQCCSYVLLISHTKPQCSYMHRKQGCLLAYSIVSYSITIVNVMATITNRYNLYRLLKFH